jgi:hypothetical protein
MMLMMSTIEMVSNAYRLCTSRTNHSSELILFDFRLE